MCYLSFGQGCSSRFRMKRKSQLTKSLTSNRTVLQTFGTENKLGNKKCFLRSSPGALTSSLFSLAPTPSFHPLNLSPPNPFQICTPTPQRPSQTPLLFARPSPPTATIGSARSSSSTGSKPSSISNTTPILAIV
jgi:hypothetical protein